MLSGGGYCAVRWGSCVLSGKDCLRCQVGVLSCGGYLLCCQVGSHDDIPLLCIHIVRQECISCTK